MPEIHKQARVIDFTMPGIFCSWHIKIKTETDYLTTEREFEIRVPFWPSILDTVIAGKSIFWWWNWIRSFRVMGWHNEWYPDSASDNATSEFSGSDGGVIGGMLKSSFSRLCPG